MLRKMILLAMGFMVVPALIATAAAQKRPTAEKVPSADNPFGDDEPAPPAKEVKAKPKPKAASTAENVPLAADDPFG